MKAKRRIAWLLSFLMVFSLIMGTSKMQVFAAGDAGETATFVINESNGQTGSVQYKLDESEEFTTANDTPVNLEGVTSITIKAIPEGNAQVNQNNSGITGTGQPATFDYDALISEYGWTYIIQGNDGDITFTIEFDNYNGIGGNAVSYSVDFGTGSWIVGDVIVTADKTGTQTLSENDIITLTGFDAETMEARVDAEDGFGTTLAVTDGQTSISAHTSDGVGPTNIAFSVVAKSSGGGGGDNPQQSGPSIEFFADSSIEGGTLAVNNGIFTLSKDGSGLGTFRVTLVDSANQETDYAGDEERILLNDISSVKIVMTPAENMKAKLITGGDTPVGALSERVFNIESNTYTYTAYPSQFGGEQKFLAVNVWFGESEDELNQVDFTAVIWDGDQVENKSEHGSITVSSVEIGSTTYTYKGNGRFENNNTETDLIEWYGYNKTSINEEAGVRIMDAAFDDPNTEVYINFVFKPDYGYQVTGIGTNESTTSLASAGFSASETISTFRFQVFQHNNPHFAVVFSESPDIINVSGAQDVNAAKISNGQNATDSGNLKLTVTDLSESEKAEAQSQFAEHIQSGDSDVLYLDADLFQVVSKGTTGNNWENKLTDLTGDITVTLELSDEFKNMDGTFYVIRQHEDANGTKTYTRIEAVYNKAAGTVTFATNKFSTYALVLESEADFSNDATQAYLPTDALFEVNGARYKVTEADTKTRTFSVSFVKVLSKKVKTFKVPTSVTYNGVSYQVVSIGKKAFAGCKKLKKISIGSNVKTIGKEAFSGCKKLKSISIGKNVTLIGSKAFYNCKELTKVVIPSKVITIESYAFKNCIKLSSLTIGKGVKTIGKEAFRGCSKLKTIIFKATKIKTIGKNSFKDIKSKAYFKISGTKKVKNSIKKKLKKKRIGYVKTWKI